MIRCMECNSICTYDPYSLNTLCPNRVCKTNEYRNDPVNHPKHYTAHPSGIECIQITRHMNFNLGNVIKYLWRTDHKNGLEDLKKAAWYLNDEIKQREENEKKTGTNPDPASM